MDEVHHAQMNDLELSFHHVRLATMISSSVQIDELQSWDLVAHPVMQVIGEQALVDILDLSEVAWTCWGCFYTQQ